MNCWRVSARWRAGGLRGRWRGSRLGGRGRGPGGGVGGKPAGRTVPGHVLAGGAGGRPVFVFSGHGAQWAGMGAELAAASPVFAAKLAECSAALAPHVDWSLEDVLAGTDGAPELEREDVLQPAL